MMVKAGRYTINPAFVSRMERADRHYVNGSESALRIWMSDGSELTIRHEPHLYDGVDIYKVEREIAAGVEAWVRALETERDR